jgi:hypothetical protein
MDDAQDAGYYSRVLRKVGAKRQCIVAGCVKSEALMSRTKAEAHARNCHHKLLGAASQPSASHGGDAAPMQAVIVSAPDPDSSQALPGDRDMLASGGRVGVAVDADGDDMQQDPGAGSAGEDVAASMPAGACARIVLHAVGHG